MKTNKKITLTILGVSILLAAACGGWVFRRQDKSCPECHHPGKTEYKVDTLLSPNYTKGRKNTVEGVVLHHAAGTTIENTLHGFCAPGGLSCHCLICYDGTRHIICRPGQVAWHAGKSILNGKNGCNYFTIGIEFWGDTNRKPLTDDQVRSAIEYLKPIISKYRIPLTNISTHEKVRAAYKEQHPDDDVPHKSDITQKEYERFMKALRDSLNV